EILSSTVTAGWDVTVQATNQAMINATVSNVAVVDSSAIKGAAGSSYGAVIASNKVAGSAFAGIGTAEGSTVKSSVTSLARPRLEVAGDATDIDIEPGQVVGIEGAPGQLARAYRYVGEVPYTIA